MLSEFIDRFGRIAGITGTSRYIFEESNRGIRSSKCVLQTQLFSFTDPFSRKHEILTRSLRKMEQTLDTVLRGRSIGNPVLKILNRVSILSTAGWKEMEGC